MCFGAGQAIYFHDDEIRTIMDKFSFWYGTDMSRLLEVNVGSVSNSAPVPSLSYPVDTVDNRDALTFKWSVSDADGDQVRSKLRITGNGRDTTVDASTNTTYTVPAGFFRLGSYNWSVTSTDGELSTTATKPFAVTNTTAVKEIPKVANEYRLEQNYPNPFNPETIIEFGVKKDGNVKLVVFDPLGKTLDVLVDQDLHSGSYQARFDASKYSSGVLFYSLITPDGELTKKMLHLK